MHLWVMTEGVNLYVKNLDESTDEAALKELFEAFGTVTSVAAMLDDKVLCLILYPPDPYQDKSIII